MSVDRLPLVQLGGEADFPSYQAYFDQEFRIPKIHDPLGRLIFIPGNMCKHICFREDKDSAKPYDRVIWDQSRAEGLGWLLHALTDPDEIRPNNQKPGNQTYLVTHLPGQTGYIKKEFYYVSVEPDRTGNVVTLLTGYPCTYNYWANARKGNMPFYEKRLGHVGGGRA